MLLYDGRVLAETVTIAEYIEELYPLPALIGRTPAERAETRQWWGRVELNITEFIHNAYHGPWFDRVHARPSVECSRRPVTAGTLRGAAPSGRCGAAVEGPGTR